MKPQDLTLVLTQRDGKERTQTYRVWDATEFLMTRENEVAANLVKVDEKAQPFDIVKVRVK